MRRMNKVCSVVFSFCILAVSTQALSQEAVYWINWTDVTNGEFNNTNITVTDSQTAPVSF